LNVGELIRNGLILRTREAVALTLEACGRLLGGSERDRFARIADDLWLTPNGELEVVLSDTKTPTTDVRIAAAALVDALLPPSSDLARDIVTPALRSLPELFRQSAAKIPPADRHLGDVQVILNRHLADDSRSVLQQLALRARKEQTGEDASPVDALSLFGLESEAIRSGPPRQVLRERDSVIRQPDSVLQERDSNVFGLTAPEVPLASDPADLPLARDWSDLPIRRDAPGVAHVRDLFETSTRRRPGRTVAWTATAAALIVASGYGGYAYRRWADSVKSHSQIEDASAAARTTTEIAVTPPADERTDASANNPGHPGSPSVATGRRGEVDNPTAPKGADSVATSGPEPRDRTHALMLPVADGAFSPSFAPSGRTLLFHAGRVTGRLMEADLDDRDAAMKVSPVLAAADTQPGSKNYHVRLSPDGRLIAFDSDQGGERGVYVASLGGADARRVSGTGYAAVPTWSPDMNWLAFVRAEPGHSKVWNLWLQDRHAGTLRRQTSFRFGQVWGASWFPDSHRICYSHENQLIIADISTGMIQTWRTPLAGHLVRTPAVSPDGRRIVFQVQRDGVWILDLQTKAMSRLLNDATAEEFAWQPDGKRIAFHSRRDGQWRIWITTPPQS
jgi:hypothetical protein